MGKVLSTACPRRQPPLSEEEIRKRRLERYEQVQQDLNEARLNEEQKTRDDSLIHNTREEGSGSQALEDQAKDSIKVHEGSTVFSNFWRPDLSEEEIRKRRLEKYEVIQEKLSKEDQSLVNSERNTSEKTPEEGFGREGLEGQQRASIIEGDSQKLSNENKTLIKQAPSEDLLVIKKASSQPPEHILMHPVYRDHGIKAYLIHIMFEDIYGFTIYEESVQEKPHLKRLLLDHSTKNEISRFSVANFHKVIQKVMNSEDYFQNEGKLIFLYDTFNRLQSRDWIDQLDIKDLEELNKILVSYAVNYLVLPKTFGHEILQESLESVYDCKSVLNETLYKLLKSFDREQFLQCFVRNTPDEYLSLILTSILKRVLRDCWEMTAQHTKDFMEAIDLLEALLYTDKRVIEFLVSHKLFLPKGKHINGKSFQKFSIFGIVLSLTTLPGDFDFDRAYFYEKEKTNPNLSGKAAEIDRRIALLRSQVHLVVDCVHRMMEHMIKVDQKYKRNILDWFYNVLLLNNSRQKMMSSRTEISSDGWFTNFMLLLLKFCEKVLGDTSKYPGWLEKIDLDFVKGNALFKDCSLLNNKSNSVSSSENPEDSEKKEEEEDLFEGSSKIDIKKQVSSTKSAFLTELIFYANQALLLHKELNTWYSEVFLKKVHDEHKNRGPQSVAYKDLFAMQLAFEVQLQDPYLFTHTYRLLAFDVLLILHSYGIKIKDLEQVDELFEQTESIKNEDFTEKPSLPFYWVENLHDYLRFIRLFSPGTLTKSKIHFEILLDFILSVGKSGSWLGHPHLKSQYLGTLGSLLPPKDPKPQYKDESFRFLFKENPYYENHLIEGLVVMFVEVEKTGTHAQFYEKFSHRLNCCMIINYLLKTVFPYGKTSYVARCLDEMAHKSHDIYMRFVMMYLNDIVCLLDEGFASLKKVKAYQDGTDVANVESLTEEEKKVREDNYKKNKGMVQYFSLLLSSYYEMGACVTKVSPDFFMTEEIRDKFIGNLNNSLQSLNGKKAISDIKVKNMKELHFDPKFLLKNIVQTYMNFSDKEEFIKGVVNDERSFDIELFHETARLLKKYSIFDEEDIEPFEGFIVELEKKAQEKIDEDNFIKELKDIPDEFYDPITADIMKDPVLLPSSKVVIDRITIMKHLLSDENDPFNRSKLTKDMLIEQPELRERIKEFFKQKKEMRKAEGGK